MRKFLYLTIAIFTIAGCDHSNEGKKDTSSPTINKYVYIDKRNVLHTKNGCKSVYKDHNMQAVNPIDPVCLSYESLTRVCSQCVSEQAIDSLHNLFGTYRQSYNNVGELHKKLIDKYSDIPEILLFREYLREFHFAKQLYDVMTENNDYSGTLEDFMEYIGLNKPAKRKSKTQL